MGAVAMQERQIGWDRGYPIMEATLYIYCDACGSFNIKKFIPFTKWIITAGILFAGYWLYRQINDSQWLTCLLPLVLIALYLPWKDIYLRYRCRNCGNRHISPYNSMHYPPYDLSSVDVPDGKTQKRYIDESVLHFHQFL